LLIIQRACARILLFFLYVAGFGFARIAAIIFLPFVLKEPEEGQDSTWIRAKGYSPAGNDWYQQS